MIKYRRKFPSVNFTNKEKRLVKYFSEVINEHFSMSEELAKAIGTVVVQALTENAKDEVSESTDEFGDDEDFDFDLGDDDTFGDSDTDFGESELPESKRDTGEVEEAEGPKNAQDLSSDFAELKRIVSNHSNMHTFAETHYNQVKEFLKM